MRPISKILAAALLILSIITFKIGLTCIYSGNGITELFNLSVLDKDVVKLGIVISGLAFGMVLFQVLAIIWILKNNNAGLILSLFIGIITLGRGLVLYFAYAVYYDDGTRMSIAPIIIGSAICILTIFAKKESTPKA
jgi:hypothetical protein